jgi:CRISPR-associated protein Cas1
MVRSSPVATHPTAGSRRPGDTSLFEAAVSPASLGAAWDETRRRGGAAGGDGISVAAFGHTVEARLAGLHARLMAGSYRPGPVRHVRIGKRGGGERRLTIPCVVDRVAQRAVAAHLSALLEAEFEESSFAYRPGRSVDLAARRISAAYRRGFSWVLEGDIDDFFDSIDHGLLIDRLWRHVPEPRLAELVGLWLESAGGSGTGLAQGGPVSPVLANMYLDELDEEMARANGEWIRYADDFVLICPTRRAVEKGLERLRAALARLKLTLHPDKTRISSFDDGFRYLGRLFLKSFILDDPDGLDPDEETLIRIDAAAAQPPAPLEVRQFRSASFDPAPAPVAPVVAGSIADDEILDDLADGGPAGEEDVVEVPPEVAPAPSVPPPRHAPITRTLYVMEKGRRVGIVGKAFCVEEAGETVWMRAGHEIDRVDIGPAVDIASEALRLALAQNIPVFFLDGHGETQGVADDDVGRRASLHLDQASMVLAPERRLELARLLVNGKIHNQRRVVQRWQKNKRQALGKEKRGDRRLALERLIASLRAELPPLRSAQERALDADSINSLLGIEGEATKRFWGALRACLAGWEFEGRLRRPPPDPVNAVLNWTAWMLTRDLRVLVRRHGLHPGFGCLHSTLDGRESCVFDLIEEFRAPIVEAMTLTLFARRQLSPEDFYERPSGADGATATWLTGDASRKVIRAYEAWLADDNLKSPRTGNMTSWRGIMREQVLAYIRHLRGLEIFEPYRVDF